MADLVTVSNSSASSNDDYTVLTDEVTDGTLGTGQKQLIGIVDATVGGTNKASVSAAGALKVDGSAVTQPVSDGGSTISVDDGGSTVSVDDGGGTLTVDNAALAVTGGGVEASALRVTLASDSTGVVSVDDNGSTISVDDGGGALTVDGTVSISGSVDTELTTADLDTGGGTDTRAVVGLVGSGSGGGALIPGDATDGLYVNVRQIPAAARTTDAIAVAHQTDAIMNGATALTPKFAVIDNATSGDNTLVAAVASKKVRVLAAFLVAAAAVNVRFESGAGGTALTGQMNVGANGGFVLPFNPVGWFETASNTLLNMELSGATSCDGCLVYVEV